MMVLFAGDEKDWERNGLGNFEHTKDFGCTEGDMSGRQQAILVWDYRARAPLELEIKICKASLKQCVWMRLP